MLLLLLLLLYYGSCVYVSLSVGDFLLLLRLTPLFVYAHFAYYGRKQSKVSLFSSMSTITHWSLEMKVAIGSVTG